MTEHEPPSERAYTVCVEPGCPEPVRDPTAPEITAASYCDEHRVLYELDRIDGSDKDLFDPDEE